MPLSTPIGFSARPLKIGAARVDFGAEPLEVAFVCYFCCGFVGLGVTFFR